MRIFQIITRSDLGGAQSVVVSLANILSIDNEVIVIAGEGDGKMWSLLSPIIKTEYIPSLQRELSPIKEIQTIRVFRKLYRKYQPDVVHLHSSKVGILGRLAFPKSKIVYTVHGFDSIRIAYRKFLPIEKLLQRRCSAIVGVSEYDKRNLIDEGIINHVETIYNGIKKPLSLGEDPFIHLSHFRKKILCIARLAPPKNIDVFLGVASMLPNYAFIWIGNQQEFSGRYPKNVFFMGSLPNAGAYNEYADLFMLPSNYEGLPMTIIEAMSLGKPVVASNVGGISEIVVNNENGFTVENTPQAFCEKISYILERDGVYEKFSKAALKCFNEKLTVEQMVAGYMKIYNKIVDGKVEGE